MIYRALLKGHLIDFFLAMQTYWGGKYQWLNPFFQRIGISHYVSCFHAHQQNGSAERKHRHIIEVGLILLAQASMPLKFWDEVFTTVIYLINRTLSKIIGYETPLEKLFLTTLPFVSLGVHVGLICAPTTPTSSNFGLNNVLSLGIAHNIRGSSALT
jgi:hypothetical protein